MELFKEIHFNVTRSDKHLTSKHLNLALTDSKDYNLNAVQNTNFSISGSVEAFQRPPVSEYALSHLYYMQDFDVFHYSFDSFTERVGFDSYLLLYTYAGHGSLTYNEKTYFLAAGDGFLIDCKKYHLYKSDGTNWDTGIFHFNGPLLPDFYELYEQNHSPVFHENFDGKIQQYLEQILLSYQNPQVFRDWQVSTYIDCLLNHILRINYKEEKISRTPENIRYLIKYLENNYDQSLSLDYLADFANTSKFYLSREFKKYTGFSPNDYIISLRIDRAKFLLENTDLPAYSIAHQIGIHDINNFTNLFKKRVGMTPIQYRRTMDHYPW